MEKNPKEKNWKENNDELGKSTLKRFGLNEHSLVSPS